MSGATEDAVAQEHARLKNAGVELESDAMQALEKLTAADAVELLKYIAENCNYLRNPSKYILNACAKGAIPKSQGGAGLQPATAGVANAGDPETMEQLLLKAQQAGVMLSNEALASLAELPPEHSVELLEFVLDRAQDLRHVSNYIVGTVGRGFKSRKGGTRSEGEAQEAVQRCSKHLQENGFQLDPSAQQALAGIAAGDAAEILEFVTENAGHLKNLSSYVCGSVSRLSGANASADYNWTPESVGMNPRHVPPDITSLERQVLSLNASTLGEHIDLTSYLALRCLPEWHAKEMLDSLQARRGNISSPCNYIQAAVNKIARQHGRGGYAPY